MKWYWIIAIVLLSIILYFVIGAALCGIIMRYQDEIDWMEDWKIEDKDEIVPCCILWPFMLILIVVLCIKNLLLDRIIEYISGKKLN